MRTVSRCIFGSENNVSYEKIGIVTPPSLEQIYKYADYAHDQLVQRGLPETGASYGTYQTYHETGAYTSPLFLQHHNASGIMFAKQHGATKGANGYAWFDNWPDYYDAFAHELTKKSNPAGAKTLEDFARRLKTNGYYGASYDDYLHGLKNARYVLKDLPATDRAGKSSDGTTQDKQDLDIPGTVDYSNKLGEWDKIKDWFSKLTATEKVVGGITAGVVLLIFARRR